MLKFGTECDLVTSDLPHTCKVKGSKVKVAIWSSPVPLLWLIDALGYTLTTWLVKPLTLDSNDDSGAKLLPSSLHYFDTGIDYTFHCNWLIFISANMCRGCNARCCMVW